MDPRQQMDSGRASVGDEGSVMNGRYAGHQQEHALAQLSPWPTVAGGAVQGFRRANDANEILQNDLENGDLRYWALHGLYDSGKLYLLSLVRQSALSDRKEKKTQHLCMCSHMIHSPLLRTKKQITIPL